MNRNRWLMILLLVSWTLNVAFVVAYFTRSNRAFVPPFPDRKWSKRFDGPPPGFSQQMRDEFHAELAPLHQERARLMAEISLLLELPELDTMQLSVLSDSLNEIRGELQRRLISHLGRIHDELPPPARQHLSKRIFGMMDGKMRPPKHGRRKMRSHFQPDSIDK